MRVEGDDVGEGAAEGELFRRIAEGVDKGIVSGADVTQRGQLANGAGRPNNFHQGALVSPGLPQVASHLATFSCGTVWLASNSAIPSAILPSGPT